MKKLLLISILIMVVFELFAVTPPPKPDRNQIARDLVGHKLKEGYEDGWFPDSFVWTIKKGEIKALKIHEVLKETKTDYSIIVIIRLQNDVNAFNAKVLINYRLTNDNKWRIEYVVSKGMKIVQTHKYDDCLNISVELNWDLGLNINNEKDVIFKNNSEIVLYFAGYVYKYDDWQKVMFSIGPHETKKIKHASSYNVEFIERY